jgi:hypothetical protein
LRDGGVPGVSSWGTGDVARLTLRGVHVAGDKTNCEDGVEGSKMDELTESSESSVGELGLLGVESLVNGK